MTKRFLITGGAGFIGSAVVRHLVRETDYRVCVVDKLTYAGNLASLAPIANNPRYSFVRADIADAARMKDVFSSYRPDVVMHLAAESHVDRSIDGPAAFIADQYRRHLHVAGNGARLLARPAGRCARAIFASTIFRPMRYSARSKPAAVSARRPPTRRARLIRHRRRRPTIWCALGITPTACRY